MYIKNEGFSSNYGKYFMSKEVLSEYIITNIPILRTVGVDVSELLENHIKLSAPLDDNKNHYGSAFGGSIATVGIVAGWAILIYKIKEERVPATLVIKSSQTNYIRPVTNDFHAEVTIDEEAWANLKTKFETKGKSGIEVISKIICDGEVCAEQKSVYICIQPK